MTLGYSTKLIFKGRPSTNNIRLDTVFPWISALSRIRASLEQASLLRDQFLIRRTLWISTSSPTQKNKLVKIFKYIFSSNITFCNDFGSRRISCCQGWRQESSDGGLMHPTGGLTILVPEPWNQTDATRIRNRTVSTLFAMRCSSYEN